MHVEKRLKASLGSILLIAGLLFLSFDQALAVSCRSLFNRPAPSAASIWGTLREAFVRQHNTRYSREVENQGDILNQCGLPTCHLHAWVGQLEAGYRQQRGGRTMQLSTDYISVMHWYSKALEVLKSPDNTIVPELRADPIMSRWIIVRYGLMPRSAWTGTRNYNDPVIVARMTEYIQNIIARTKAANARETNAGRKEQNLQNARAQITRVFEQYVGAFDTTFSYNGRTYTPHTFRETFFPHLTNPIVSMAVNENRREPNRMLRNETQIHITTNIETLAQTAKALIDQGLSVYLGYSHNDVYVNYSSGIMTIAGFNAAPGAAPPSRADRNQLAISANGHVVQIVGYDLGPSGNIIKWKIKNSWGQDAGTNGYFHMYHDYFNTFALDIYFFQDARIPLPATVPLPLPEQRDLFE